jgi:hypothetical protein
MKENKIPVVLPEPHVIQKKFIESPAKRKIIRAGRRSGKTVGMAILAIKAFLDGQRVLYAAPTEDQLATFWYTVKSALLNPLNVGIFKKNEVLHTIELPDTKQRIRAKTAYNVDTLRGDFAGLLILDEWQLMDEQMWDVVGAPMLADVNGSAVFVYTPPSLHSRSMSKARDPLHAAKMFKKAEEDKTGRWEAFFFTSFDNPYISHDALEEITQDMTTLAYRQEILAEDIDEAPGALWTRDIINKTRISEYPDLVRIAVGVDPTGSQQNECGIVVAGLGSDGNGYIIDDRSLLGSPGEWADEVLNAYNVNNADIIVGEANYGGEMVEATIEQAAKTKNQLYRYKNVHATRGKAVRAEPIVAAYEHGRVHHVGEFPHLENEMVMWIPGISRFSPTRIDALVWAITELNLKRELPQQTPTYYIPDLSHTPTRGQHS